MFFGVFVNEEPKIEIRPLTLKLIYIQIQDRWDITVDNKFPLLKVLWGADIWVNGWPLLKIALLINMIMCGLVVWVLR